MRCEGYFWRGFAVLMLAATAPACGDDDGASPNGGEDISVAELEVFFGQALAGLPAAVDGYQRLHQATLGNTVEGVTLENLGGNSWRASVALDLDGDGSREVTISGTATNVVLDANDNFVSGNIALTGIEAADMSGSGSMMVEVIGGGGPANPILLLTQGQFAFMSGPVSLDITDLGLTLDLTFPNAPFLEGFVDFEVGNISAGAIFEADGLGGWRTRVSGTAGGSPFEFTIP